MGRCYLPFFLVAPPRTRPCDSQMRITQFGSFLAFLCLAMALLARSSAAAETPPAPTPQKVQELLTLLRDPTVADWLTTEIKAKPPQERAQPQPTYQLRLEEMLRDGRQRIMAVGNGFALLGPDFASSRSEIASELTEHGFSRGWQLIIAFIGLGLGSLWLALILTRHAWQELSQRPINSINDRLRVVLGRAQIAIMRMLAFTLGSLGLFLLFDWPPKVRTLSIGILAAAQGLVGAAILANFMLAPARPTQSGADELRIFQLNDAAARAWFARTLVLGGLLSLTIVARGLLEQLGFNSDSVDAAQFVLGLALAAAALETVWRGFLMHRLALSLVIAALLAFSLLRMDFLFWLTALAALVPLIIAVIDMAVRHLTRPVNEIEAPRSTNLVSTAVRRGARAIILLVALWALEQSLPDNLANQSHLLGRIVTGLFHGAAVLVVFDFAWYLTQNLIDRKIAEVRLPGAANDERQIKRQRLGTLLPILKNFLLIAFLTIAALMTLSAMGVAIGPLLAGASVIGVAVGFGAQTLVKDVLSGFFYLLDDAFRVGEYIQSGNYKGTVESFTLRSVKLRHHRGPVYTVPFGTLGAIENLSRDWVLEKIVIAVAFDTDLPKVKKLIKQVGAEMLEDPEFAPHIIETIKMQGVEEFSEYGIRLRLKLITRPGEQFPIRRRAYQRIKELFDVNGVRFAVPKVQVAEGEQSVAAAAASNLRPISGSKVN
jgi:moderate conductance mechanosensitive channel